MSIRITGKVYQLAFERLWNLYSSGKLNFDRFAKRLDTLNRYYKKGLV